jgi:hypothetical protein
MQNLSGQKSSLWPGEANEDNQTFNQIKEEPKLDYQLFLTLFESNRIYSKANIIRRLKSYFNLSHAEQAEDLYKNILDRGWFYLLEKDGYTYEDVSNFIEEPEKKTSSGGKENNFLKAPVSVYKNVKDTKGKVLSVETITRNVA